MLFKFLKTTFQDRTFISRDGQRERLSEYTLTTTRFVETGGSKYAAGWDLVMPGRKEEHYTITPVMDGCINLSYFEELCSVRNEAGEITSGFADWPRGSKSCTPGCRSFIQRQTLNCS